MPTSFPGALDTFTNPTASDPQDSPSHSGQHANANDAIEAIEALLGTTAAPNIIKRATVSVSSADILDLHNTPVTLVAAPGAGKFLVPHRVSWYFEYGTVAYATDDGEPDIRYASNEGISVSVAIAGLPADNIASRAPDLDLSSSSVNSALRLTAGGSVFTLGDGTLTFTVWYSVEDVP
jgi:hypothetical protein